MNPYDRNFVEQRPRRKPWVLPTLILVALGVGLVVFGQYEKAGGLSGKEESPSTTENASAQATTTNLDSYRCFKATKLLGKTVKNREDKDLGTIEDLVINMNTGDVRYAVLSFGGPLGVGDDWYAIPLRELRPDADDDDLVANLDRERLEGSKKFARDTWPEEKSFWDEADQVYGIAPAAPPTAQPSKSPTAYRASELEDKDVRSLDRSVGTLKDLVIDMNAQKVHYVVLERAPEYGGTNLVALPLRSLLLSADNHDLVLTVDGDRLRNLRSYEVDRWPDANDRDAMVAIEKNWNDVLWSPAVN